MDLPLPMKSRRALWVRSVACSWEQACAQLLPAMAMDNEVDCLGNRAVTANGELKGRGEWPWGMRPRRKR